MLPKTWSFKSEVRKGFGGLTLRPAQLPIRSRLHAVVIRESNSSRGSQAQGHYPRKTSENPADPHRTPQRPRRAPRRDPAEPSERPPQSPLRQISSESLAEGCAPWMVTLRNFRNEFMFECTEMPTLGSASRLPQPSTEILAAKCLRQSVCLMTPHKGRTTGETFIPSLPSAPGKWGRPRRGSSSL